MVREDDDLESVDPVQDARDRLRARFVERREDVIDGDREGVAGCGVTFESGRAQRRVQLVARALAEGGTVLRADLVIIDEVGFAPLDDNVAQLLFRFASAYECRVLVIGSH